MEDCAIAVALELQKQGFTIARAEPSAETEGIRHSAVADYLLDHKGLRPAMTDAELDWQRDLDLVKLNLEQLRGLSGFILTDGELDVLIQRVARVTEHFSEKYRG